MTSLAPALDLEATPVPGQLASAVLDLDGNVVSMSGATSGSDGVSKNDVVVLYQMLLETGHLLTRGLLDGGNSFRRFTVTFSTMRYVSAMRFTNEARTVPFFRMDEDTECV
jgi:hypothetical protein